METADQQDFRASVREFCAREIAPFVDQWEVAGQIDSRQLFPAAGKLGIFGIEYDPAYGGLGLDHRYSMIAAEELGAGSASGVAMALTVQAMMATPSLHQLGSEELKQRYLAPAISGEAICSVAVTEPGAGSDVAALSTRARRDGDDWVINGRKMYITNGVMADWMCVLVRTSDEGSYRGMSQVIIPTDSPGFAVARKLDKLGNRASDTAELTLDDVRVPVGNTVGEIGRGFQQQMQQFVVERLAACYTVVGGAETAIARTWQHLRDRSVFGGALIDKQYVTFRMAELAARVELLRSHNRRCADAVVAGADPGEVTRLASIGKLEAGRLSREVADTCLQFHGGMGYMEEFWPARFFRDSRLTSIGGGADEVMLQVLSRIDEQRYS